MLWPPSCVSVDSHSWPVCEVTFLDVFEPLETDVMEEREGALTHALAMVKNLGVSCFSLLRSGAMVTMQCSSEP